MQFQTLCSQDVVQEGDVVEYKDKKGTVKWWKEENAWAIQETVGGQVKLIVDPLIWMFGTEEAAYPKDDKKARSAANRKKQSIRFSRGEKRWYAWAAQKKSAAVPAAGSPSVAEVCPCPPFGAPVPPRVLWPEAT